MRLRQTERFDARARPLVRPQSLDPALTPRGARKRRRDSESWIVREESQVSDALGVESGTFEAEFRMCNDLLLRAEPSHDHGSALPGSRRAQPSDCRIEPKPCCPWRAPCGDSQASKTSPLGERSWMNSRFTRGLKGLPGRDPMSWPG